MIPTLAVTELSRWQFAFTAIFHFLFVPLTLGLTWLLVIMEGAYVLTNKIVYKDMTRFWGKLLAINFAIGVISGITMEFEFGLNWAYFSRMIGGSFGPILAIEGITAFMLEATMFGLFFFSWTRISKNAHFLVTLSLAVGATLSIVNILAANSWMQHPVSATFYYRNMTMQLHSLASLYMHALAQIRIGHVAFAGFTVGSIFVMGISAYYIRHGRDLAFAKNSFAAAVVFGLICAATVFFFGDENGLDVAKNEPEKMAAMEGQWETQKPPASWYLVAFPSQSQEKNYFTIQIPWVLTLIATPSNTERVVYLWDLAKHLFNPNSPLPEGTTVTGLKPIMEGYHQKIQSGMKAYGALEKLRHQANGSSNLSVYEKYVSDLGFGYLLLPYTNHVTKATPAQITAATKSAIPSVAICFWAFRVMIGCWFILLILLICGCVFVKRNTLERHPFYLKCCTFAIPLPFIAAEAGWILAEVGRQPWIVHYVLPTFMGTSTLDFPSLVASLTLFVLFYAVLIAVELFLMFKFARLGPSALHTGKYYFERHSGDHHA